MAKDACRQQTAKKYRTRDSPPYSAQDCPNQTKPGRDGVAYVSKPDKRGVYRWLKAASLKTRKVKAGPKPKATYEIHDNGGRPFLVEDHGGKVTVYRQEFDEATETYTLGKKVLESPYKKLFVGTDPLKASPYWSPKFRGNSLLLHVSGAKYMFIGLKIYSFKTLDGDAIRAFYSPVGNSDVPYAYAIGEKNTYLFLEEVTVPNEDLDPKRDAYSQYYGFEPGTKKIKGAPLRLKVLQKRML
jgi:hypothetical protein